MAIKTPEVGFIFWPVGTGDSTTIKIDENVYMQVDIRNLGSSREEGDPACAIIDELVGLLPEIDGKPFLSTFVLTHPDLDHCQGFQQFSEKVFISELWMSPRTFKEFRDNEKLCDDADAFHSEALRRVKETVKAGGDPGPGNRIRIIGYDHLLNEDEFAGLPEEFLSFPGHTITEINAEDVSDRFSAFVHAPFKDDSYGDRNDCSLAFQINLSHAGNTGQALLMGDLKYPIIRRIFDSSEADTLSWNILLAPHHCSKSVFYWKGENDDEESLRTDLVRDMANSAQSTNYIVSSSRPIPPSNQSGDNPPHAKAKKQYLRLGPNEFFCTHEHPNEEKPIPVVFEVNSDGLVYLGDVSDSRSLEDALKEASGTGAAPTSAVGFGDELK